MNHHERYRPETNLPANLANKIAYRAESEGAGHAASEWMQYMKIGAEYAVELREFEVRRRLDDGQLAECPLCNSLDIGGACHTVNCYQCGLQITKDGPLQNAIDAWNTRNGKLLPELDAVGDNDA